MLNGGDVASNAGVGVFQGWCGQSRDCIPALGPQHHDYQ